MPAGEDAGTCRDQDRGARQVSAQGGTTSLRSCAQDDRVEVLARTELLAGLPPAALHALAEQAELREYAPGELLMKQGERGDAVLVLVCGAVTVHRAGARGARAALSHLRPPAALGELTLLDGGPRSASVQAVVPTAALSLSRGALLDALSAHPAGLDGLLRSLGRLVRRLSDRTADAVLLDLPGRLAKTLLVIAASDRGSHVVRLSQSHLAELVGCSRQSLNQALGGLADRGLLHVEGRAVVLDDVEGLRRRAGLPPPASRR